jgi:hypothetical protein
MLGKKFVRVHSLILIFKKLRKIDSSWAGLERRGNPAKTAQSTVGIYSPKQPTISGEAPQFSEYMPKLTQR